VDFAHHGVAGYDANKAPKLDLRLVEDRGPSGFVFQTLPADPSRRGIYGTFTPPSCVTCVRAQRLCGCCTDSVAWRRARGAGRGRRCVCCGVVQGRVGRTEERGSMARRLCLPSPPATHKHTQPHRLTPGPDPQVAPAGAKASGPGDVRPGRCGGTAARGGGPLRALSCAQQRLHNPHARRTCACQASKPPAAVCAPPPLLNAAAVCCAAVRTPTCSPRSCFTRTRPSLGGRASTARAG
jgi:hypothetical protein